MFFNKWFQKSEETEEDFSPRSRLPVLKEGMASKVIFYYPGEEGTYVEDVEVQVYENGIVLIQSGDDETLTHIQNCEIVWSCRDEQQDEDKRPKLRILPMRAEKAPQV